MPDPQTPKPLPLDYSPRQPAPVPRYRRCFGAAMVLTGLAFAAMIPFQDDDTVRTNFRTMALSLVLWGLVVYFLRDTPPDNFVLPRYRRFLAGTLVTAGLTLGTFGLFHPSPDATAHALLIAFLLIAAGAFIRFQHVRF